MESFLQSVARCLTLAAGLASAPAGADEETVRMTLVPELRALLDGAAPLDQIHVVSSWASSPIEGVRLSIARALDSSLDTVGVRSALDALSHDVSAPVRSAARLASQHREAAGYKLI